MRAATLGNLRNTLGSTSIAVDTGSPVMGHLIIMELIAGTLRWICVPTRYSMELLGRREPCDRDDLKTAGALWIKSL
jgi:hypothetical protein